MKYVNVGKEIVNFEGKGIPSGRIVDDKMTNVKLKDILNQYVSSYLGKDTNKVILSWRIGQKIFDAEGELALEDAEFDLVMECIETNLDLTAKGDRRAVQHSSALLGPVLAELKRAEKAAEENEEKKQK